MGNPPHCDRRSQLPLTTLALMLALLSMGPVAPCLAADSGPPPPEEWTIRVTALVMAADLSGEADFTGGETVGGNLIRGELDYGDVYPDPQPLWFVDFSAKRGRWGLWVRGQYLGWDDVVALANMTLLEETSWFVEADAGHAVGAHWWMFLGIRRFDVELVAEIPTPPGLPFPPSISTWVDESWTDPIAGAEFRYALATSWEIAGRGDVGGFGVGSQLSWSLEATLQWNVGRHFGVTGGYRVFDTDYENEWTHTFSGGDSVTVTDTYDTRIDGPTLGLTFHW